MGGGMRMPVRRHGVGSEGWERTSEGATRVGVGAVKSGSGYTINSAFTQHADFL